MPELSGQLPLRGLFLPLLEMVFRDFSYRRAHYKLGGPGEALLRDEIMGQRNLLEKYIALHPDFRDSLVPVPLLGSAPEIARRMAAAADVTRIGPMASVAGAMAQWACERVRRERNEPSAVENGGDLFLDTEEDITLGLYAGKNVLPLSLAFFISRELQPLAVCSSSGTMGHSLSLGLCDLATVTAKEAALADSAATLAGNLVRTTEDLSSGVERILDLPGILGVLLVKDGKIGMGGNLPELIRLDEADITPKITRDRSEDTSFPVNRS